MKIVTTFERKGMELGKNTLKVGPQLYLYYFIPQAQWDIHKCFILYLWIPHWFRQILFKLSKWSSILLLSLPNSVLKSTSGFKSGGEGGGGHGGRHYSQSWVSETEQGEKGIPTVEWGGSTNRRWVTNEDIHQINTIDPHCLWIPYLRICVLGKMYL